MSVAWAKAPPPPIAKGSNTELASLGNRARQAAEEPSRSRIHSRASRRCVRRNRRAQRAARWWRSRERPGSWRRRRSSPLAGRMHSSHPVHHVRSPHQSGGADMASTGHAWIQGAADARGFVDDGDLGQPEFAAGSRAGAQPSSRARPPRPRRPRRQRSMSARPSAMAWRRAGSRQPHWVHCARGRALDARARSAGPCEVGSVRTV